MSEPSAVPVRIVGRYALYGELAAGGMATVHLGRLLGPVGFSRTVAIKRLHEQFAKDPEFVSMFLDEARLCARIRHPNVVPTLDVIAGDRQLLLVMEYVQGESLSRLQRAALTKNERVPLKVAVAIMAGVLHGLHAAHEAKDEKGQPLGIVHRDVSPQNVLVGADGVARVLDFGIAKAKGRLYTTQDGRVKGKLAYMAPEQLRSERVDRKSDIFAASIMAWELIAGKRLFEGDSEGATVTKVLLDPIPPPSSVRAKGADTGVSNVSAVPPAPRSGPDLGAKVDQDWAVLDAIILRGLERDPTKRYDTARDMANDLEEAVQSATAAQVGTWVESIAGAALHQRSERVQEIESGSADTREGMDDVITKLTSDADVTKTQERSSGSGKIIVPPLSAPELASKAHIAVSKSDFGPIAPRDPWPRRAAIALACVALAIVALYARSGRDTSRGGGGTGVVAASPSESAHVAPPPAPSIAETTAVPEASIAMSPTPSATASAPVAPPSATVPKPGRETLVPKPAPKVDCRDPYTRDSLGRKIYKLECL
jgi:eukaryotic-like serine/threonine-protein kinase